jgi:hypothetical protein
LAQREVTPPNWQPTTTEFGTNAQYEAYDMTGLVRNRPEHIFNDDIWLNFIPNDLINAA